MTLTPEEVQNRTNEQIQKLGKEIDDLEVDVENNKDDVKSLKGIVFDEHGNSKVAEKTKVDQCALATDLTNYALKTSLSKYEVSYIRVNAKCMP